MGSPKHDYRSLRVEYVAGEMTIRELAASHGITAPSSVHEQARKPDPVTGLNWYQEREQRQGKTSVRVIDGLSEKEAARLVREYEVKDHAIDLIDAALVKATEDMKATKVVQRVDPQTKEVVFEEEPVMRFHPRDVAGLIDKIAALFGGTVAAATPDGASLHGNLNVNFDGNSPEGRDVLAKLAGLSGGRPVPVDRGTVGGGSLPDAPGPRSN